MLCGRVYMPMIGTCNDGFQLILSSLELSSRFDVICTLERIALQRSIQTNHIIIINISNDDSTRRGRIFIKNGRRKLILNIIVFAGAELFFRSFNAAPETLVMHLRYDFAAAAARNRTTATVDRLNSAHFSFKKYTALFFGPFALRVLILPPSKFSIIDFYVLKVFCFLRLLSIAPAKSPRWRRRRGDNSSIRACGVHIAVSETRSQGAKAKQ